MTDIKIGGVPEHFNLPWQVAIEQQVFSKHGVHLVWKDYPGGTGAMCAALRNNELDLAVLLTEGIIADITKGNPSRIIKWFVTTPLLWGIHVDGNSPHVSANELEGKRYAISRYGSGSHLMAFVDAHNRGWQVQPDQLVPVGDIIGALKALKESRADIFLWEKFMTKPYVDSGILKRVGEVPTPWPSFALAATELSLHKHIDIIEKIISCTHDFHQRMYSDDVPKVISQKYNLKEEDAKTWLQTTAWSTDISVSGSQLSKVADILFSLKLIDKIPSPEILVSNITELVD